MSSPRVFKTAETARPVIEAELRRRAALTPLAREAEDKALERKLDAIDTAFISESDERTVAEILAVGETTASRRERAEAEAREAPGKAAAAKADADRRAASDKSMEAHAPRPTHEMKYPYMDRDFPKQTE
jgi:hypothetical protein